LIAAYGHLGRQEDAKTAISALNDLRAKRGKRLEEARAKGLEIGIDVFLDGPYTLKDIDLWPFKKRADRERLRAGLKKAGVPASAKGVGESPIEVAGVTTVDAAAAKALFDRGIPFVDVRTLTRWDLGRIPGGVLLDLKIDFDDAGLAEIAGKDQEVVIYCEGPKCLRSSQACTEAVSWGFTKVYYFRDGFPGWRAAGYPVEVTQN
jgi:rhodanese-related sulfurtransferase